MRQTLFLMVVLALLLVAPTTAEGAVLVSVADGTVNADGSATVAVTVTCPKKSTVLEAHLTLSQDDQTISGTAGFGPVRCTGRPKTHLVTVRPLADSFHTGPAYASPFVLVQNRRTGATESGGSAQTIVLG